MFPTIFTFHQQTLLIFPYKDVVSLVINISVYMYSSYYVHISHQQPPPYSMTGKPTQILPIGESITFDDFTKPIYFVPIVFDHSLEEAIERAQRMADKPHRDLEVNERTVLYDGIDDYFMNVTFDAINKSFTWKTVQEDYGDDMYFTELEFYKNGMKCNQQPKEVSIYFDSDGSHWGKIIPTEHCNYQGPVTISFSETLSFPSTRIAEHEATISELQATVLKQQELLAK